MNILFVCHCADPVQMYQDPSVRYRCYNPAEDLSMMGHNVDVGHIRFIKKWHMDFYDAVVFHRPVFSRKLARLVKRLYLNNNVCVADFDDLLFSEDHAGFSPALLIGWTSKRVVEKKVRAYAEALTLFDQVTVATEPLAKHVRDVHPSCRVAVIPNGLSGDWVRHGQRVCVEPGGRPEVGYLPGTKSHDHDMDFVKQAVFHFLLEHRSWDMTIVGPLSFDPGGCSDRFHHEEAVHYYRLPLFLKRFQVTLAPLVDNPFNRSKSAIKYLESAAMGVPVIASAIPDMVRFKGTGVQLCHTASDFRDALERLAGTSFRQRIANEGRRYVLSNEMSMKYSQKMVAVLVGNVE